MNRHILVVEDQEDNRQILRDLLGNAGYEVTEAENGEEAIAAVAQRRPDLILMDIQLPVMDGYEATRRIRTNPDLKFVPIIAVTSFALAGDESKALEAGCNSYVSNLYVPETWSVLIPRRNRVTWRDDDRAAHLSLETAIATKQAGAPA